MLEAALEPIIVDIDQDDEPAENLFPTKQQRLWVRSLYASWKPDMPFLADANVGLFPTPYNMPIVPDMFLSLDVVVAEDWYAKRNRSYFVWEFGKSPEVVIEVLSNKKGREADKQAKYARMGIQYYVIYDPQKLIQDEQLRVYELHGLTYYLKDDAFLDWIGLGLVAWEGEFEQKYGTWIRWVDADGNLLLTGSERAADAEGRATDAEERVIRLAEKLRELGIDPDTL